MIAARAVVTKDVEPYSIMVGNPAQHVRYRFDEPTREALLRIKWWDWADAKVAAHRDQISSPEVKEFVAGHDPELGEPSCEVCRSASRRRLGPRAEAGMMPARSATLRAGIPNITALSGASASSTELAPIWACSPTRTGPTSTALASTIAPSQIVG